MTWQLLLPDAEDSTAKGAKNAKGKEVVQAFS